MAASNLPGGASGLPNRQSSPVHHVAQDVQPAVLGGQQVCEVAALGRLILVAQDPSALDHEAGVA